ncbi:MAG: citrate/2-methylcitrate synthase [Spirochaetales bacterium]|nr:citrate/2-methylcitrate synthase [Spirochaetales bacterium]
MIEKSEHHEQFLKKYSGIMDTHNRIPLDLYEKYNVKRGLRHPDGTGVLVGLTEIGDVHGYIMEEGDKVPVKGILRYRGIDVKELCKGFQKEKRFGFEETVFLLLFGYLPSKEELKSFNARIGEYRALPDQFTEDMILKAPSNNIMNKLARSILASYSFDDDAEDTSVMNILRQSVELIAQLPVMAAYAYQAKAHYHMGKSLFIHKPDPELSTAENLLRMIRPDKKYTSIEAEILDLSLVLHAEHGGGNNSAFSTHVVSSSGTDTYSAIAAAIGSLKGPLHGGANIQVARMMDNIKDNVKDWNSEKEIADYITKILMKDAFDKKGLIYGMGHAVYTLSDPRAEVLKDKARELAEEAGRMDEFTLYEHIERLTPGIFQKIRNNDKPLCANVDFYSGFVYSILNIPEDLYTPIFAIARIPGWCAHRVEEIVSGGRIIRPAYKSVSPKIPYSPLESRE